MDNFTITTRITKSDYKKFLYQELYKKPLLIFATLVGLYFGGTIILDYLNIIDNYPTTPYYEIVLCLFIFLGPIVIVTLLVKSHHASNPSLQHDIQYTFGNNGISVQGFTFKSELSWSHIIKQRETKKYLILYNSKKSGEFIDKSKLTTEQMQFIKSKVQQK